MKSSRMTIQEAEILGLRTLEFLAGDRERMERFLALSGTVVTDLPELAGERTFLAGVLDHILSDETGVFLLTEALAIPPDAPAKARDLLAGGSHS